MRQREGGEIIFWPAKALVKLDAQNPSPAAWLRDEAMPRCRAPDEEGTLYAE